mgnify:CR=1 FL=1
MKISLILIPLLLMLPAEKVKVWKEKKGVVVLEAEHIQARNDPPSFWKSVNVMDGYSGTGMLQWSGSTYIEDNNEYMYDDRIINLYVMIEKEGVYYFKLKGTIIDEPQARIFVSINSSDWNLYHIPNTGSFTWDTNTIKNCYPVFFPQGYHRIEVAAATTGFLFDKAVLFHESQIDTSIDSVDMSHFDHMKESGSRYVTDEYFPKR